MQTTGKEKDMNALMAKYKKLERIAEETGRSIYADAEAKREAWKRADVVWQKIVALKKRK